MARLASSVAAIAVLAVLLAPATAQQQDLVASARQANVINVQFFADSNFLQTKTPFAYYNFPAISAGSCSACEDFPVSPAGPSGMLNYQSSDISCASRAKKILCLVDDLASSACRMLRYNGVLL